MMKNRRGGIVVGLGLGLTMLALSYIFLGLGTWVITGAFPLFGFSSWEGRAPVFLAVIVFLLGLAADE
jgi:hypothetical protein